MLYCMDFNELEAAHFALLNKQTRTHTHTQPKKYHLDYVYLYL